MMVGGDGQGSGRISAGMVGDGDKFCGNGWEWGQISIPVHLSNSDTGEVSDLS